MDNFKLEKNGYNKKEVDEFVEKVKRDYEDTLSDQMARISELKKQLDETNKKLDSYQKKSGDISDALVVAVETAKQIEDASKNVYELEIKRIRSLYTKWENFLNELMEEYPRLKDRFDTKALLKIFNDGIDDVIRENAISTQSPMQSAGLRSLISKMNKKDNKSIEDSKVDLAKRNVIKPAPRNTYYDNLTSIGTVAKQQEEFDREYELFIEEQEQLEKERQLKLEQERKEKLEQERKLAEEKRAQELLLIKQEQERQAKLDLERKEQERLERERQQALLKQRKLEEEQLKELEKQRKLEQEKLLKQKEEIEKQKQLLEKQRLESIRLEKERLEAERLAKQEQEKLELERKRQEEQERLEIERKEKEKQENLKRIEREKELTNQKFEKSYFDDAPQLIDEDIFLKMGEEFANQTVETTNDKPQVNVVKVKSVEQAKEEEPKKSQIKSISNIQMDEGDKFESLVDKFLLGDDEDDKTANEYEKAVLSKKKKDNSFDLKEAVTPDDDLSTIMASFDIFNSELEANKENKNK